MKIGFIGCGNISYIFVGANNVRPYIYCEAKNMLIFPVFCCLSSCKKHGFLVKF